MCSAVVTSRSAAPLRVTAIAVATALTLGSVSGVAQASQRGNQATEAVKVQAVASAEVFQEVEAPEIVYEGLEERFVALGPAPTIQQIVEAMYPGNESAQRQALEAFGDLTAPAPASAVGAITKGLPVDGAAFQSFLAFDWHTTWQIARCVGSIGVFIAGNAVLASKLTKLGGIYRGARLVVRAGNFQERMKALTAIFGEITGLATVANNCY